MGVDTGRKRREVCEILESLKRQREDLERKTETRLARYDARILAIESRFKVKISVSEMRDLLSIHEMEEQLRALRERESLLRKAQRAA